MRTNLLKAVLMVWLLAIEAVHAHEFWISPRDYTISTNDRLEADFRTGDNLSGAPLALLTYNLDRLEIISETGSQQVAGRLGDIPAVSVSAPPPGLAVIVHQTKAETVKYTHFRKFTDFVEYKGFPEAVAAHRERGLPDRDFRERFWRFAKSLVAVGHGRGMDRAVGLEAEIVAEANPYSDDMTSGLPVRVLYRGEPRADARLTVFARDAGGRVTATHARTDGEGRVLVPVEPGHEYLLDSVILRPVDGTAGGDEPVWESLWASLTFRVP